MTIVYRGVDLKDIMPKLREVLEGHGDVVIAVVFGSAIRRRLVRDLDIAVYFEGRPSLKRILRLAAELEEVVNIPVDLTPLNLAPPGLVFKVLATGKPILVRDRVLLASLLHRALGEHMDIGIKLRMAWSRGRN